MLKDRRGKENSTGEARDPIKGTRGLSTLSRCAGRLMLVGGAKAKRFRGVTDTKAT